MNAPHGGRDDGDDQRIPPAFWVWAALVLATLVVLSVIAWWPVPPRWTR